jgi:hypothetical protein
VAKDWDKELAKVDKAMAREGNPRLPPQSRPLVAPAAPAVPAVTRRAGFYTWLRLSLALVLGIGMTQWPYLHGCGFSLFAYMGGVVTVMVASCWSMISSWRSRSVVAHFLSVGLLFWGSALGARELLPRMGYARQSANWFCAQPGQPNPPTPVP